jgi:hypothetical protein
MKKIILSGAGLIMSIVSFSQFSVGVQASANLSGAFIKNENDFDYSKTMRIMPAAGIVAQYEAGKHLAIRSGISYMQHGITLKATVDEDVQMKIKAQTSLHYLQVPVTAMYLLPFENVRLFAGIGGYFGYGISGKVKETLSYIAPDESVITITGEIDAFEKEEEDGAGLKRTDFGAMALAGVELKNGLFVNVGYQLGLANIDRAEEAKYKNRGLQITIGYLFRMR